MNDIMDFKVTCLSGKHIMIIVIGENDSNTKEY